MCKVLVVEDDNTTANFLSQFLTLKGNAEVNVARSFDEAVVLLKDKKYQVIITDIALNNNGGHHVNDKNGYSVVAYARSALGLNTPVIYYSNFPKYTYEGDDMYIEKPNFNKLLYNFNKVAHEQ